MVRYTIAVRGAPKNPADEVIIEEQEVQIFQGEQLSEHFLRDINPKGQVPVLVGPGQAPMPDSLAITLYLAERYPKLLPNELLRGLLKRLHDINYFALSYTNPELMIKGNERIKAMVHDESTSNTYREALKYKLEINETEKLGALKPGIPEQHKALTREVLDECGTLLPAGDERGPWLGGFGHPTALDAHLVVLIARLKDSGQDKLIPSQLIPYVENATAGSEWNKVMEGRRTMPGK